MKETTVVIANSENQAVFTCIESIGNDANIVVSLTPSHAIESKLSRLNIPFVVVPRGNLGKTFNAGIEKSETDKVILMTDDSVFTNGAIDKVSECLERVDACKTRIIFESDPKKPLTHITAELRDYANASPTRIFTPGLGIHKGIKQELGGHFFNEDVRWAEDAEFSYRFKKHGLSFAFIQDAAIIHPPISLKHDLTGAFLIGLSKQRSVELGLRNPDENFLPTMKRIATGETIQRKHDLMRSKGTAVFLYGLLWDGAYNAGYNLRRAGLSDGIEEVIWEKFGRGKETVNT